MNTANDSCSIKCISSRRETIKADNIIMTSAIWVYYSLEIDCADINKLNDDSVSQYTIKENNVHHIRCTAEYKESTVKYDQWFM